MSLILVTIRITVRIQESELPKSEIRIHWIIEKLPTVFDEILWTAGAWPRDQLFTFCLFWLRSASLSRSGKNWHNPIMLAFGGSLCSLIASSLRLVIAVVGVSYMKQMTLYVDLGIAKFISDVWRRC